MEIDNDTLPSKKVLLGKTGYNINTFIDIGDVANKFIENYYTTLGENNIQKLIDNKIIRTYTTIKYNKDKLTSDNIIPFLNNFHRYKIKINTYNYIDSGSRRIDISVIGNLTNETEQLNFNQTFIICNQDNSWYLKNSIFLNF